MAASATRETLPPAYIPRDFLLFLFIERKKRGDQKRKTNSTTIWKLEIFSKAELICNWKSFLMYIMKGGKFERLFRKDLLFCPLIMNRNLICIEEVIKSIADVIFPLIQFVIFKICSIKTLKWKGEIWTKDEKTGIK